MNRKKAFLVGINDYPEAPLQGCVNDVSHVHETLVGVYKLDEATDLNVLTNRDATRENIMDGLRWLAAGARSTERLLHFSGHGAQLPGAGHPLEPDGLTECLCPVDFNWTPDSAITDEVLGAVMHAQPGATAILDCCFAGGMTRAVRGRGYPLAVRTLQPPRDVARRLGALRKTGGRRCLFANRRNGDRTRYLLGSHENQTCADASFGQGYEGAFTHFLLQQLRKRPSLHDDQLMSAVAKALLANGFSQIPQLRGERHQPLLLQVPRVHTC